MTTQPCPTPEVLGEFLEGRLDPVAEAELRGHLAACEECFEVFAIASADQSAAIAGPGSLVQFAPRTPLHWTRLAAAAAGVLIGVSGWMLFLAPRVPHPETLAAALAEQAPEVLEPPGRWSVMRGPTAGVLRSAAFRAGVLAADLAVGAELPTSTPVTSRIARQLAEVLATEAGAEPFAAASLAVADGSFAARTLVAGLEQFYAGDRSWEAGRSLEIARLALVSGRRRLVRGADSDLEEALTTLGVEAIDLDQPGALGRVEAAIRRGADS